MYPRSRNNTKFSNLKGLPQAATRLFALSLIFSCIGCDAPESTPGSQDSSKEDIPKGTSQPAQKENAKAKLGTTCKSNKDCATSICKAVDQAGKDQRCSACDTTKDCESEGSGLECVLAKAKSGPAHLCKDAPSSKDKKGKNLGEACDTYKDCQKGLTCAPLVTGKREANSKVCSECDSYLDCNWFKQVCITHPNQKYNVCASTVGAPDAYRCKVDAQCRSGLCEMHQIEVVDNFELGFCVECKSDEDCKEDNQWCRRAVVDRVQHTITPAKCESGSGPDKADESP